MARTPAFVALVLLLLPAVAGAITRHVPAQFATIQAAINASTFGDVVQVAAGTYHENIFMQQIGVSVLGAGAGATTIDGGGNGRVIEFFSVSSTTTFSGFRVTGGVATTGGGGIRCVLASPQILDCIIEGNTAPDGGGIFLTQSRPLIKGCTIRNNLATGHPFQHHQGGGLFIENNSPAVIEDCEILDNESGTTNGRHGAFVNDGTSSVTMRRCLIRGNKAWVTGGLSVTRMLLEDSVIEGNTGGAAVVFAGPGTMRGCTIKGNPTGGVVFHGPGTLTGCTIAFNTFKGLELQGTGVVVDHTIVAKNFNTSG